MTILVTGATGNIGAPLVNELVAAGQHLRAFVTDPAKAKQKLGDKVELAKGNLNDPASLDAAMKGVTKVFLLAPPGPDQPFDGNVVNAAKKAGVTYIVKLSVAGAQYDATLFGKWHRAGEKKVEASGIPWTFLRPVGFMDNAYMWAQTVKSQGAIYQPMGDGKMACIDARDIASVAAKCLTTTGHANKAYDLTGPEALSMHDQAKQLGDAIGKPVKYVDVPDSAAKDAMLGMGFPAIMADAMLEFTGMVRAGQAAMVSDAVKTITGKPGRTFAAWCREHAAAFK
jgi:(4-alkanoyl-5-oxo-2,5-dihydrofuran-3-yl)methyl phosphate reductase